MDQENVRRFFVVGGLTKAEGRTSTPRDQEISSALLWILPTTGSHMLTFELFDVSRALARPYSAFRHAGRSAEAPSMAEAIESERRQAAAALDWGEIDAELHDVEWLEDYREQRFYPLKQVVDIFSSGDPEGLTLEVREPSC